MELVGRIVLVAALVASPWPFGSVTPEPQWWLCATIAGLLFWRLAETLFRRPEQPFHIPLAIVAPVGILIIATVQLLPREQSPVTQMEHAVFAEWGETFTAEVPRVGTICPAATRFQTARLFFAVAAFLLGAQWFSTAQSRIWLWRALAINGAALGFFGIVQKVTWNGLMFWSMPLRFGGSPFASYVNRNNAAAYLNLCLAAGIGWLLLQYGSRLMATSGPRRRGTSRLHWKARLLRSVATVDGPELALLGLLALISAAVLFSLSRAGILSMAIGLIVIFLRQRGTSRLVAVLAIVLLGGAAAGLLMWVGGWEIVEDRLASLSNPLEVAEGRLSHWWDTSGAVRDFPLLGTGFGAYRYANLPYQIHQGEIWFVNADNHYFEMLVETGILGLGLFAAGFLLTGLAAGFLLRQDQAELRIVGTTGLFAVVSQALQAMTDFSLLMPANLFTFAVLCGSVTGSACSAADFHRIQAPVWLSLARLEGRWGIALVSALLASVSVAFGLEVFASTQTAIVREIDVPINQNDPLATRAELLEGALESAETAIRYSPDDPELHRTMALWWIDRYRLEAAREIQDSSELASRLRGRQLWQATSLSTLNFRINEMTQQGELQQVEEIRQLPLIRDYLIPARIHLLEASRHCPLSRDVSRYLAHLSFLSEDKPVPVWQSEMALRLEQMLFVSPSSPDELFEAGIVANIAGRRKLADKALSRCLVLSEDRRMAVWSVISQDRDLDVLLKQIIPPRVDVLVAIAVQTPDEMVKSTLAVEAQRLLNEEKWVDPEEPSVLLQAQLSQLLGQSDQAIQYYQLALGNDHRDIEIRLQMARLLLQENRLQEAEDQFSLLHKLAPKRRDILDQLEKLKLRHVQSLPQKSN